MSGLPMKMFGLFGKEFRYDPEDDKLLGEFALGLKKLPSRFEPKNLSWDINRIDAFKRTLSNNIKMRIADADIVYEYAEDKKRDVQLIITVNSNQFGTLSTLLEIGMLRHKDCPHNLPSLIAVEFAKEIQKPN
jgi:hypothetical protein